LAKVCRMSRDNLTLPEGIGGWRSSRGVFRRLRNEHGTSAVENECVARYEPPRASRQMSKPFAIRFPAVQVEIGDAPEHGHSREPIARLYSAQKPKVALGL